MIGPSTPQHPSHIVGKHVVAELSGCDKSLLNDEAALIALAEQAAVRSGATILKTISHAFSPQGVTVLCMLAESHLSIHTWPEHGYAAVDIFTCGNQTDVKKGITIIIDSLGAQNVHTDEIKRGEIYES